MLPGYNLAAVAPLLPPSTANRADLSLAALPLKHGLAYTFEHPPLPWRQAAACATPLRAALAL
eukprot:scaffold105084_cov43-Phaeocystis_antarctica.AAC.1